MNVSRRGFLTGMLPLGIAPAIVRADSLMRVISLDTHVIKLKGFPPIIADGLSAKAVWPGVNSWWAADYAHSKDETAILLCRPIRETKERIIVAISEHMFENIEKGDNALR